MLQQHFSALQKNTSFSVGETHFNNGLSFVSTWQLFEHIAPPDAGLDFFSIVPNPPSDAELSAALTACHPSLQCYAQQLMQRWQRRVPGWNRWHFAGGRVRLTLVIADTANAISQIDKHIDIWLSHAITSGMEPSPKQSPRSKQKTPTTALVIGGGLAGCASAYLLSRRGVHVTLVERSSTLASGASGNPRGILHARFGASMTTLHRFVLAAYGHALTLLDEVIPADGVSRAECGLLQLASPDSEAKRIGKLAALSMPPHLLQFVNAARASEFAGLPMMQGGLWFPAGGWVVPPQVCARLAAQPNITLSPNHTITTLSRTTSGWRASGNDFAFEAEQVVVCCGHQARTFAQFAQFPLQAVRGQISAFPASTNSQSLRSVVCAEGYCAPAVSDVHIAGATTHFDDESTELRAADHAENLSQLARHVPSLHQALGTIDIAQLKGRAGVRCSAPGSMPLVGEVERGLYCSLAHGTRGLLSAGISAEVIAASMCGQLPPLPADILTTLSPQRLLRHI